MPKYVEPIGNMHALRVNRTLHGRSVHRPGDVPGHNVFKGYNSPGTGDALDLFCDAGEPVIAIADGVQTRWQNDTTRLEVIYLQGEGWLAVYAHINASREAVGVRVQQGEVVGHVRGDLNDPHLHFELWLGGRAVHAPTAGKLRMRMLNGLQLAEHDPVDDEPRLVVAKNQNGEFIYNEIPSRFDHNNDRFLVDTRALANYLGRSTGNMAAFVPIRQALPNMGINDATFDTRHLDSREDPRVYVFVP